MHLPLNNQALSRLTEAKITSESPSSLLKSTASEWESVIPIDKPSLISWPEYFLPSSVKNFVEELSTATETPIELPALMAFSVLSTACAGKYVVEVKQGYIEPLNIWTCVALPPASLKTAIFKAVLPPLKDWEANQYSLLKQKIKEAESLHKTLTERIAKKRKDAANTKSEEECTKLQQEVLQLEGTLPIIPKPPQLWTGDVTAEKLAVLMADNDERMGLLSDEGGLFENMAGRYSGGIPNLDVYLQGHAGSPVRVDRQGRPPVVLEKPSLVIGLTPQPDVLKSLENKPSFRGRGLLARFLYALPPSNLGKRKRNTLPVTPESSDIYYKTVTAILNHPWAFDETGMKIPKVLRLDDLGLKMLDEFSNKVEIELGDNGSFAHIRDWAGKLVGAVVRLAGIIHVTRHALNDPTTYHINSIDVESAIAIGECLSSHVLAVFDLIGADNSTDKARVVAKWIKREQKSTFTFRDCNYSLKSHFKRANELQEIMDILEERHYVRAIRQPTVAHRPSKLFEVNPNFLDS